MNFHIYGLEKSLFMGLGPRHASAIHCSALADLTNELKMLNNIGRLLPRIHRHPVLVIRDDLSNAPYQNSTESDSCKTTQNAPCVGQ